MLLRNIKTKKSSATVFFREMKNLSDDKLAQILPKRDEFRNKIEQVLISGIECGELRSNSMHRSSLLLFWVWPIGAIIGSTPEGEKTEQEVAAIFMGMILQELKRDQVTY